MEGFENNVVGVLCPAQSSRPETQLEKIKNRTRNDGVIRGNRVLMVEAGGA